MNTGAKRLHMYNSMHIQLETTRIHMAASERPMYTSSSVLTTPVLTKFLKRRFSAGEI